MVSSSLGLVFPLFPKFFLPSSPQSIVGHPCNFLLPPWPQFSSSFILQVSCSSVLEDISRLGSSFPFWWSRKSFGFIHYNNFFYSLMFVEMRHFYFYFWLIYDKVWIFFFKQCCSNKIGVFRSVVVYIGEETRTKHVKFSKFKDYYLYVSEGKQYNA